jgi:hypothetical protein
LAGRNRLIGNARDCLRLQRLEKRRVHLEENLFASGLRIVLFGLRAEFGAAGQVCGPAEVSNELGNGEAFGISIEDAGIVQSADGREPGVFASRSDGDNTAINIWEKCGTSFVCDLAGRECAEISHADARMALEGGFVSLRASQERSFIRAKIEDDEEDEDDEETSNIEHRTSNIELGRGRNHQVEATVGTTELLDTTLRR